MSTARLVRTELGSARMKADFAANVCLRAAVARSRRSALKGGEPSCSGSSDDAGGAWRTAYRAIVREIGAPQPPGRTTCWTSRPPSCGAKTYALGVGPRGDIVRAARTRAVAKASAESQGMLGAGPRRDGARRPARDRGSRRGRRSRSASSTWPANAAMLLGRRPHQPMCGPRWCARTMSSVVDPRDRSRHRHSSRRRCSSQIFEPFFRRAGVDARPPKKGHQASALDDHLQYIVVRMRGGRRRECRGLGKGQHVLRRGSP